MGIKKIKLTFCMLLWQLICSSQELNVDSLQLIWKNKKLPDTVRLNALDVIAWDVYLYYIPESSFYYAKQQYQLAAEFGLKKYQATALNTQGASFYIRNEYDSAMKYHSLSLKIREELKDYKGMASSLNNIGVIFKDRGDYSEAEKYYEKGLLNYRRSKDKKGESVALNNLANVYADEGNYAKAIQCYTKSLTIREALNDEFGIASSWFNIGHIYTDMKEFDHAMECYNKSLSIHEKIRNKQGVAASLNGIGNIYYERGEIEKAMEYYQNSLREYESIGNVQGISNSLNSIGNMYFELKKADTSLVYYLKALKFCELSGDMQLISHVSNNIGKVYTYKKRYGEANRYCKKALSLAKQVGAAIEVREAAATLYKLYKLTGNNSAALEMFELHVSVRDSIFKNENQREIINQKYKHDYELQAAQDSVKNAEEQKIKDVEIARQQALSEKKDSELKNQRTQQYALFGGLALVIVFSFFIYNRFRITQKQKLIIEQKEKETHHQKDIIEEKQKEIIDSINYAKRLQQAILAPKDEIDKYFPENFLFYKPKDIVAGDFYFFETTSESIFYAAADCTGHGVPGAMVSIVCSNALTRSVKEFELTDPGKILDKTRDLIVETFLKSKQDVKDGMDISIISIDRKTRQIKWAGANNPLWYIENDELKEINADKQPIGKTDQPKPFTTHDLPSSLSVLFLFTDGFADQFGGPKGKKFKYSNLQKLLLENANEKQETILIKLEKAFTDWKGELEQVDDVCIIGIRL